MNVRRDDRREFLASSCWLGLCSLGLPVSSLGTAGRQPSIVRKDARELAGAPDELAKYREAFRRVKQRGPERPTWNDNQLVLPNPPNPNKRGYAFQALLHTNHCPHGNWWFLPWHRVYIFYFEQILQQAVEDFMPGVPLAIPYWNWTDHRGIPAIFSDGTPSTNPLNDDRRFSQPLLDSDVGPGVIQSTVDQTNSFTAFGSGRVCSKQGNGGKSLFEGGPHDIVHVKVGWFDGQGRPGNMRIPPTAGFDPVFWSHHANIDRLWDYWLSLPGRSNPAFNTPCRPNETRTWGNLTFTEFVDREGQAVNRSVEELLTDPLINSVVYKEQSGDIVRKAKREVMGAQTQVLEVRAKAATDAPPKLRLGSPESLTVSVGDMASNRMRTLLGAKPPRESILFRVEGLEVKGYPAALVRAFLNKADVGPQTPTDDPHYVGYFTFFGEGHEEGEHKAKNGANVVLNLTPNIRALGDRIDLTKPLTVTLLLMPIDERARQVPEGLTIPFKGGTLLIGE